MSSIKQVIFKLFTKSCFQIVNKIMLLKLPKFNNFIKLNKIKEALRLNVRHAPRVGGGGLRPWESRSLEGPCTMTQWVIKFRTRED